MGMAPALGRKSRPVLVVAFSCHQAAALCLASLHEAHETGYSCSRREAVLCTGSFSPGQGPLPSRALGGGDGALEEALSTRSVAAVTAAHPRTDIIYVL